MTLPLGDNGRPGGGGMALPLGDNGRSAGAPSGRSGAGRRASVGAAGCSGGRPSAAGRPLEITRDDASATSVAAGAGSAGSGLGRGDRFGGNLGLGRHWCGRFSRLGRGRRVILDGAGAGVSTTGTVSGTSACASTSGATAGAGGSSVAGAGSAGAGAASSTSFGAAAAGAAAFLAGLRRRIRVVVGLLLGRRLLGCGLLLGRRLLGRLRLLGLFVAGQPVTLGATGHHVGVRFGERGRRALGGNAEHSAEVEDLGVRHPELFRELVDPDLLRSHVVDSTFHSRLCLADAGINAHPGVRLRRPDGRPVR